MTALYRKYRPQDFDEVVGQEAVVRTLRNAIEAGKVRQAYLFAGPRGTGKTSLARILAKALNCAQGPTPKPDRTCHACVAIADGTSLDVIEMDAASQRGIDDIREIRERVVLQPVEGRYKVYILDEAHQLTDAAWNALLKLIEEPPPHLVFVFCTTDRSKVLPTVRSRCQTFVFPRPRLPELVSCCAAIADGEGIEAPDAALSLVARSATRRVPRRRLDARPARGGDGEARSPCRRCCSCSARSRRRRSSGSATSSSTATPAGALTFVEELSEQGQDLGRLVTDLLEHLRHLMLVQHLGEVPESLPVTEETRDRLRAQANQLGEATVLRLCDLLAVAVDDMRQGGDPRLPLELALVKVTRPGGRPVARVDRRTGSSSSSGRASGQPCPAAVAEPRPDEPRPQRQASRGRDPSAGRRRSSSSSSRRPGSGRSCRRSRRSRSRPRPCTSRGAPDGARGRHADGRVPGRGASFHRQLAEEPKNATPARRGALRGDRPPGSRSRSTVGEEAGRRRPRRSPTSRSARTRSSS